MRIVTTYSDIDRRFYVYLFKGNQRLAKLGSQIKKPTKETERLWKEFAKCIVLGVRKILK